MSQQAGLTMRRGAAVVLSTLLLALGGATAAGAAELDPRTTRPADRPAVTPSVQAEPNAHGIEVTWDGVPGNVTSVEVHRASGGVSENLTPEGISGNQYFDGSAVAGTAYSYTVKARELAAAGEEGKASVVSAKATKGQVLGTADATIPAEDTAGVRRAKARAEVDQTPGLERKKAKGLVTPASAGGVRAASHSGSCLIAGGTLGAGTTTWSSATCPDGYLLTEDVIVPAGSTLVVSPGTTVYFATTAADPGNADGVPGKVDLIVDGGTLVADGTNSSQIRFTSINANATDTATTPAEGDWGVLAGLTGSTMTLEWVDVSYGNSLAFFEIAPPLAATQISHMSGATQAAGYRPGGIDSGSSLEWLNPPAGSTISMSGITLGASANNYGAAVYSPDLDANGYTVNVTGSTFTGYYPLWVQDNSEDAPARMTVNISGNQLREISSGNTLYVTAYEWDNDGAEGIPGTATVTGTVANNVMTTPEDNGYGIYAEASSDDSHGIHTINFSNNDVRSYYDASENYAYGGWGVGDGNATLAYSVTGTYISNNGDAWYDYAEAGDAGTALAGPDFANTRLESADDYALYVEAYGDEGDARAIPTITDSSIIGYYGSYVYAQTYGVDDEEAASALAEASPTVNGSLLRGLDDYALYADAYGYTHAAAEASPSLTNVTIDNSYAGLWTYADTDGLTAADTATASPTVTSSRISTLYYEAVGAEAYTSGEASASASPVITDSELRADDDDGIYVYAQAYRSLPIEAVAAAVPGSASGDANAFPVIDGSTVQSYSDVLYVETYTYGSGAGDATTNPVVRDSTLRSYEDDGIEAEAYAQGDGDAVLEPEVRDSTVEGLDDEGLDLYASHGGGGTGDTHVGGVVSSSVIRGEDDAVEIDGYSYGDVDSFPTTLIDTEFLNSTFRSVWDDGVDAYGSAQGGTVQTSPVIRNSSIEALDGDALDISAWGWGSEDDVIGTNPTITNVDMNSYGGLYIDAYDAYNQVHDALVHIGGLMTHSNVFAKWSYAIESYLGVYDSSAGGRMDLFVLDTPMVSYDGVYLSTVNTGCADDYEYQGPTYVPGCDPSIRSTYETGDTVNGVTIQGTSPQALESWWDYGVETYGYAYEGAGTQVTAPTLRGLDIRPYYDGVYGYSYSEDGDSVMAPSIVNNSVSPYAGTDGGGVYLYNYSSSGGAHMLANVASNTIRDMYDEGIYVYNGVPSGDEEWDLNIAGNTVTEVRQDGIEINSGAGAGPDDQVHIVRNVIDRTGQTGIDVSGLIVDIRSNTVSRSGWGEGSTSQDDNTGISVVSSPVAVLAAGIDDAPTGIVRCNIVSEHYTGIYYDNAIDPATNENSFENRHGDSNTPWNLVSSSGTTTDATGNWWGVTGTAIDDTVSGDVDTSDPRDETACRGGYELDGFGGLHGYGPGTPAVTDGPYFGWDIARAVAIDADGASGKVLDGYGGIHGWSTADATGDTPGDGPYFGWDIARDFAFQEADPSSGYVLDGYGGIHSVGDAPDVVGSYYNPVAANAKRIVLRPDGVTGYVLTGDGRLHPFGPAGVAVPAVTSGPLFNQDIARDVIINHEGNSGYILDGNGAAHPWSTAFGTAGPTQSGPYFGFDIANAMTWFEDDARYILDGYGGIHINKNNTLPLSGVSGPYWPGWDIARDFEGLR